ncbi:polysaccharide ABC transporter ATP-binding protein [Saccharicrinis sp. 156]|uniref:ABC transporter ATP-binding protein n=1 Tax=Saccharicrinis sp. 156 TaxID=3417574 RepID=UPI003D346C94
MSKTVIKIENLSKIYRLGEVGTGTLSHDLNRFVRMNILGQDDPYAKVGHVNDRTQKAEKGELVAALRDINLEVKQGEVLGIIGKNGAGKSTLLKLLSRVTSPTTGSIKVKGRLASLLEVGTGFHPEMTGRENIYMNGTIMGMRKWEIDRKLDEIVEFAGVAKYLDTPTKRYSSGMTVRLGFAIAAHLEPEILVVDEVLAVGDAEFQKKAIGKMQDVSTNDGRTVLFVSHNMGSMRQLCKTGILLSNGTQTYQGTITETIETYLANSTKTGDAKYIGKDVPIAKAYFKEISLLDSKNELKSNFLSNEEITVNIKYKLNIKAHNTRIVLQLITTNGETAFASTNILVDKCNEVEVKIPSNLLNATNYFIKLHIGQPGIGYLTIPQEYLGFNIETVGQHGSKIVEKWPGVVAPQLTWYNIV